MRTSNDLQGIFLSSRYWPVPCSKRGTPRTSKTGVASFQNDMQPNLHWGSSELKNGEEAGTPNMVWGGSPAMAALQRAAMQLSPTGLPLLITGEAGSGRRTLAKAIHQMSEHRDGAFVTFDCVPPSSEGLPREMPGLSSQELPDAAVTVFLRDIGELSPTAQESLVQAMSRTANGNGEKGIRWIASTSKDLQVEVRGGRFRGDLYGRIAGVCLYVSPLRHRREDVLPLAESFQRTYSALLGCPNAKFSARLESFLMGHSWPGNVRELEDAIRTILAIGNEDVALMALRANGSAVSRNAPVSLKQTARAASRRAEQELILKVLSRTRWNRKRAAAELQISYKALLYKLKQIGLEEPIESRTRTAK